MILDLVWLFGWIAVGVGAYLGGLPLILVAAGSFVSHMAVLYAMKPEREKP